MNRWSRRVTGAPATARAAAIRDAIAAVDDVVADVHDRDRPEPTGSITVRTDDGLTSVQRAQRDGRAGRCLLRRSTARTIADVTSATGRARRTSAVRSSRSSMASSRVTLAVATHGLVATSAAGHRVHLVAEHGSFSRPIRRSAGNRYGLLRRADRGVQIAVVAPGCDSKRNSSSSTLSRLTLAFVRGVEQQRRHRRSDNASVDVPRVGPTQLETAVRDERRSARGTETLSREQPERDQLRRGDLRRSSSGRPAMRRNRGWTCRAARLSLVQLLRQPARLVRVPCPIGQLASAGARAIA